MNTLRWILPCVCLCGFLFLSACEEDDASSDSNSNTSPQNSASVPAASPSQTRSFHMGFTTWPYEYSVSAVRNTWKMANTHGDMVAVHLDSGVPWTSISGSDPDQKLPAKVEETLSQIDDYRQPGKKLYIGVAGLGDGRSSLAGLWETDDNQPLPKPWSDDDFDAPEVIDAYSSWCLLLANRYKPDWMNICLEGTELAVHSPNDWPAFVTLMKETTKRLKAKHPDMPVGISLVLCAPGNPRNPAQAGIHGPSRYFGLSRSEFLSLPQRSMVERKRQSRVPHR